MIACVRIPCFAAGVERRADPRLEGVPLVIGQPADDPRQVYAASCEAVEAGVQPDMPLGQARALCPELFVVPAARSRYRRALDEVLETLATFSSRVEAEDGLALQADARRRRPVPYVPPGQVGDAFSALCYLDLGKLAGDETLEMAQRIHHLVRRETRLDTAIGLASGKFAARVAAASLNSGEALGVLSAQKAAFLANFPVHVLPVDGETLRQLDLLGLRTLGQVAALPAAVMLDRFGAQGRIMHRLANGRDTSPVQPYEPPPVERLVRQLDGPASDQATVEAACAALVEELVVRLQVDGKMARELALVLWLEDGATREKAVVLRQATASASHLSQAARELLASMQVSCGVAGVEIGLGGIVVGEARQLTLFDREPVAQDRLQAVVRDLIARYGEGCFHFARLVDPDARLPERRFERRQVGGQ